jgi:hypothetical protein
MFLWEIDEVGQPVPFVEAEPALVVEAPRVGNEGSDYADPDFQRPSCRAMDHVGRKGCRHKSIDFLIKSGLSRVCRGIERSPDFFIQQFDAIPDVSVLKIPVLHFTVDVEKTSLFRRFFHLLGEKNAAGKTEAQLGLITLEFEPAFEASSDVVVLFSESPLRLNIEHPSVPRCEILFIVSPIDQRFYRISTRSNRPRFWCDTLQARIISADHIAQCITITVFQWVASYQKSLLFAKDQERLSFLQTVPHTRLTDLDIAALEFPDGESR